jgi:hypothetical protein
MPSTNGTISEVIVGTGVLYVASIANDGNTSDGSDYISFPGVTATAWDNPASDWVDVGYSEDGWTLEMDKTFEDIMVAEEIDPIATYKTAQEVRLTGELAQASMANLQIALGGGTFTSSDTANYGSDFASLIPPATDDFDEKSLLLIVDGPNGADRHVEIPRAINVGAFSMAHQKAPQKVVIAVEFKVLKPKGVQVTNQHTDLFRIVDNKNDAEVFDIN